MTGHKFFPLVVIAAGLLAYSDSFTGTFVRDDFWSISQNPTIQRLWPIWRPLSPPHQNWLTVEGRPLINLSLAISYALSGYNVWGYHVLNLAVHLLAGLTLFGIVRRTLLQPRLRGRFGAAADELALATAVLWTVHPLQAESVTYIIQRAESIMGLFYLLTLYCFIRGVESSPVENGKWFMGNGSWELRSRLWYGLSVTACALGMASKEVMVSAPVMVLLYDRAFVSASFREAWRRRWPLYLALASTWILLGFVFVSAGIFAYASMTAQHVGRWAYLATQPGVILYYLRLSVWPSPLSLDHQWPIAQAWWSVLPPTVAVVVLLGATAWAWRRNPAWGFVGAWFFLILAPTSSVIPLPDPMYEHRLYLSLAAVVSVVVMGLYSLMRRHSLVVFLAAAVGLGFLTWRRNHDYQRNPHYSFGLALQVAGRAEEAIAQYKQVLRITPDDPEAHYNLGVALEQLGRVPEAIEHYEQALRLRPDYAAAHNNLGSALLRLGKVPEAIAQYERALQFEPGMAEAHYNLALALRQAGRVPEAIEQYNEALRFKPDYAEAHYNLGNALFGLGNVPGAIAHYERALQIKPDFTEAHYNLGVALERTGRATEAIRHYEQALRLQPDYAAAQSALVRLRAVR
ncbi:MAG TPA: tetratricopeptide repeat protein [Verrucomicrobiae bacterium]|nr:tetratricopeptide repeat protein [Verrucomicrobiae bacterium]